jgi:hypothetical protein
LATLLAASKHIRKLKRSVSFAGSPMRRHYCLAVLSMVALSACAPGTSDAPSPVVAEVKSAATANVEPCADDGPRFEGTGLCIGRAINYIDPAHLLSDSDLPASCSWELNQTLLPIDEALLYQAVACNGKKTELEFRDGAHMAALAIAQSGLFDNVPEDYEPVKIVSLLEITDPQARILAFARDGVENAEEAAACEVRPLGGDAPADWLVVDVNATYKEKYRLAEGSEPGEGYAVCGPAGYTSDATRFWRITGGYAFLFDFGQDMADFNAGSLTVIAKDANGNWAAKP